MNHNQQNVFPRRFSRLMRALAWLLIVLFAASCTRDVVRGPLEVRRYTVDWDSLPSRRTAVNGLVVDSVVLTPAQWPLEGSVKQLFAGNFQGVIENFDLSFHSSTLRDDMLERLFDKGFLPVLLRVRNEGQSGTVFEPSQFAVRADADTVFFSLPAEELPGHFKEIDWGKTGANVLLAALVVVVLVAAAKQGRSRGRGRLYVPGRLHVSGDLGTGRGTAGAGAYGAPSNKGLLRRGKLAAGAVLEGFLFFRMDGPVTDWSTARLERYQ
ncbi:MAG: hypothetical protein O7B79_07675 [SAR324 cluster bacterium]|nr:hypothetical protein [SAR324 cluster bacterium]